MCCSPGIIDGEFGPGTEAAVLKFQQEWGLTADGIVGDETWSSLIAEIRPIQRALKKKGFYSDSISGIAKAFTFNAVTAFQRSRGLTDDGMVCNATRARLFHENEDGSVTPPFPLSIGSRGDFTIGALSCPYWMALPPRPSPKSSSSFRPPTI